MLDVSDIFNKIDLTKLIPIIGNMTKKEKQQFLLKFVEAIARGAAEGAIKGQKGCN